jgi:ectoine hydroxylase-related dioxygenase (phytanoyl-CoA dioxygenase family)
VNDHSQFSRDGFLVVSGLLPGVECDALAVELTALLEQQRAAAPHARGGLRNVLRVSPRAASVASSGNLISVVSDLMGGAAFPVRAILFDKTDGANWGVPWHQDFAITVAERVETPGFGPWSVKEGIVHVQPPPTVLAAMITIRLQLDDCRADDGVLRVLPGSHLSGELDAKAIRDWADRRSAVSCDIPKGGALLMRPLLLHASSPAKNPSHRRVLHVEYAATELPNGLMWSERT